VWRLIFSESFKNGALFMKNVVYVAALSVLLLFTGCAGTNNSNQDSALATVPVEYAGMTNPLGSGAAGDGAVIYKNYCASCHGETGKGDGFAGASLEPKPKDLSQLSAIAGDDYLFWRISTGKPATAMVGWRGILEDDQIWRVVSFIRSLK
jgi:mono/diheme cytochrome c family protein